MSQGIELIGLQMAVRTGDAAGNLDRALAMLREAAPTEGSIVVLPEMWSEGFDFPDPEGYGRRYREAVSRVAGELPPGAVLITDGPVDAGEGLGNTVSAASSSAEVVLYRKAHLLPGSPEPGAVTAGTTLAALRHGGALVGIQICFDLRFPVPFRSLARAGCLGIVVPAQWPAGRIAHWETLLRARAIENQCYVLGVNAAAGGNPMGGGRSLCFGPNGETVAALGEDPGIIRAAWEPDEVERLRARLPFASAANPSVDGGDQGATVTKGLLQ